jgi:hypothetical protein
MSGLGAALYTAKLAGDFGRDVVGPLAVLGLRGALAAGKLAAKGVKAGYAKTQKALNARGGLSGISAGLKSSVKGMFSKTSKGVGELTGTGQAAADAAVAAASTPAQQALATKAVNAAAQAANAGKIAQEAQVKAITLTQNAVAAAAKVTAAPAAGGGRRRRSTRRAGKKGRYSRNRRR